MDEVHVVILIEIDLAGDAVKRYFLERLAQAFAVKRLSDLERVEGDVYAVKVVRSS